MEDLSSITRNWLELRLESVRWITEHGNEGMWLSRIMSAEF